MNQHQSQLQSCSYPIGMTRRVMNARALLMTWFEKHFLLIIALILTVLGGMVWFAHHLELRSTIIIILVVSLTLIFIANFEIVLILLITPILMCTSILDLIFVTRHLLKPLNYISLIMLIPTCLMGLIIWLNFNAPY